MIDFSLAIPVDFCTYQNSDLVFAFAGLQALTNFNFHFVEKIWVCPEMVADAIYPYTHRGSERVKEALDQLKAKRIVMRAPGGGYYVDQDSFAMPRDFVRVPMSDLKKFISNRKNVPELFSFYCFLLSTRAAVTQFKVGYMPQVYLAEQFGVSVAGVMRYNKALEEIGVLYVKRMPPTRFSKERQTNVYGATRDRKDIDSWAPEGTSGFAVNEARRISAEYNLFVKKKGAGYSQVEFANLEKDCLRYNEIVRTTGRGIPKDMSVFDRFAGENLRNDDFEDMFE